MSCHSHAFPTSSCSKVDTPTPCGVIAAPFWKTEMQKQTTLFNHDWTKEPVFSFCTLRRCDVVVSSHGNSETDRHASTDKYKRTRQAAGACSLKTFLWKATKPMRTSSHPTLSTHTWITSKEKIRLFQWRLMHQTKV